jgi:hypothetical protein
LGSGDCSRKYSADSHVQTSSIGTSSCGGKIKKRASNRAGGRRASNLCTRKKGNRTKNKQADFLRRALYGVDDLNSNVYSVDAVSGMSMPESCGWMMSASVYNDFQVQEMDWGMVVSVMGGVSECGGDLWVAMTAAVAGTINANVDVAMIEDSSTLDQVMSDVTDAVEMVVGAVEEAVQVVGSVINEAEGAAVAAIQDGSDW